MRDFLLFINDLLWGSIMFYLLTGAGLWFLWHIWRIPLRYFNTFFDTLKNRPRVENGSITPFQALTIALAARAGSGNLAAAALALVAGGPGAIFWMGIAGLFGMAIIFAESALAQLYRRRNNKGYFRGGPSWYMEHGLGMYWVARIFAVLLVLTFGFIFNALQASSISKIVNYSFNIPPSVTAATMAVIVVLAIRQGIQGVARITQWLVPLLTVIWLLPCLGIIFWNIGRLPDIISTIISSAFGWHSAAAGAFGYTLGQALNNGFQHGSFSSDAGQGSTPNVAAASSSTPAHPVSQGIVQLMGVFIDTLAISTLTATLVLLSGMLETDTLRLNGHMLVYHAMTRLLGQQGGEFITLMFCGFAVISVSANIVYAENSLSFLMKLKSCQKTIFRICVAGMIALSCFVSIPGMWQLAKVAMALLSVINLSAILLLTPALKIIVNDWLRQRSLGLTPTFDSSHYPELHGQLEPDAWTEPDNASEFNRSHWR
ncbi:MULTISPECIES: alanine/glycine:cation symporter family protein [Tenebrionibacter/Tenebrionicola group]|jgi:AGCS family alanine or glycine:cation symporter|uniref:Sodium:alanine symporter family protein n=2 Tax=Tenebrionibacter/Tenebrionicola group TaxID=2969848 RepID=A0A8K0V5B8_9ENTR|nr:MULTISPECIES: amino acid carrier protein [Tenebrionibacter/Tenebrionicola group]MBK4715693.1 sodium:alanine symporter family protein [Tenebrionibacter intestinalis]MBV5096446.1 sodium:alanine symporter family protein [Tenebrionicola larvae]